MRIPTWGNCFIVVLVGHQSDVSIMGLLTEVQKNTPKMSEIVLVRLANIFRPKHADHVTELRTQ